LVDIWKVIGKYVVTPIFWTRCRSDYYY